MKLLYSAAVRTPYLRRDSSCNHIGGRYDDRHISGQSQGTWYRLVAHLLDFFLASNAADSRSRFSSHTAGGAFPY
jgi:hypothetical protein